MLLYSHPVSVISEVCGHFSIRNMTQGLFSVMIYVYMLDCSGEEKNLSDHLYKYWFEEETSHRQAWK